MKHFRILLLVSIALAAQQAFAAPPTILHTPVDTTYVSYRCGFAVSIHQTGTIIDIISTDAQGVVHDFEAAPQLTQVMTNVATGKSITVTTSGPGTYTFNPDGSFTLVGTGLWAWSVDPDTSESGWVLTKGRFVLSIDVSGNQTFSRTGTKIELCAELG